MRVDLAPRVRSRLDEPLARTLLVLALLLGAETLLGSLVPRLGPILVGALAVGLVSFVVITFVGMEAGVLLLVLVSFFGQRLALLSVQGRELQAIHLVGGGLVAYWLLSQAGRQRFRLPSCPLNAPMIALIAAWLASMSKCSRIGLFAIGSITLGLV